MRFVALAVAFLMPLHTFAATPIQRDDAFMIIWNAIKRPAVDVRETPFTDVTEAHPNFQTITYAKSRGILDDTEAFFPDETLTWQDGLMWLFRTRNIDDPDLLTVENMSALLERYPIIEDGQALSQKMTDEELRILMQKFDDMLLKEVHESSLYSEKFHGKGTAFGESFDMYAMTAAHRTFPYNTLVKVTNIANGKSVTVRINDRGPYVKGRDLDLSLGAFTTIAERSLGKINVTFQRLGDESLVGECKVEPTYQRRVSRGVVLDPGVPNIAYLGDVITFSSSKPFVVREVRYPAGQGSLKRQDWVNPGERYTFSPSMAGDYVFRIGSKDGMVRSLKTTVADCKK